MDNKEPNFQMSFAFIDRQIDGNIIQQRMLDGYINATALCKAAGKRMYDYLRLENTKAFIFALESKTGIPASAQFKPFRVEMLNYKARGYILM